VRIGKERVRNNFTYNRKIEEFLRAKKRKPRRGKEKRKRDNPFSVEPSNLLNSGKGEANFQLIMKVGKTQEGGG